MTTETQRPDGELSDVGLNASVFTDHDADPDSDSSVTAATGNNISTEYGVDFPTTTEPPTVGAGLQEFRAGVVQFDSGQAGVPTARIELWENGVLVRAGAETDISTFQVLSFTWNANELATADGSLVQCKVIGTKSGGSPTTRNTVNIGQIEWNADVSSAPVIVTGDGSANGTSSVSGDGVLTFAGDGASFCAATVAGGGKSKFEAPGTSVGSVSVTGDGVSTFAGDGLAFGIATVTATGQESENVVTGDGFSAGIATISGDGAANNSQAGSSSGVAVAMAVGNAINIITEVGEHPEDMEFVLSLDNSVNNFLVIAKSDHYINSSLMLNNDCVNLNRQIAEIAMKNPINDSINFKLVA